MARRSADPTAVAAEPIRGAAEPKPSALPARRRVRRYNRREAVAGYLFISPWIVGFLVFTAGAMIYSLVISFSHYNLATNTARPAGSRTTRAVRGPAGRDLRSATRCSTR